MSWVAPFTTTDLLIVHQLRDPIKDGINYDNMLCPRYKFQIHTMFKSWDTGRGL